MNRSVFHFNPPNVVNYGLPSATLASVSASPLLSVRCCWGVF